MEEKTIYTLYASPVSKRSLKKLSPPVRTHLKKEIQELATNPLKGKKLEGAYRFLRCLKTRYKATDYRVAYRVHSDAKEIDIIYVSTRENFYEELGHYVRKKLGLII